MAKVNEKTSVSLKSLRVISQSQRRHKENNVYIMIIADSTRIT